MDSDGWLRILSLVALTLGAAYFAATETSFAAMNKLRIQNLADNGDKRAKLALKISNNFDRAITTLLIGNNITHIAFAALVTLIATQIWGVQSVKYLTIVSTVHVFLFSEMIPKSIAKANSDKFVLAVSGSLHFIMRILSPVTFLFMYISKTLTKLFPADDESVITEEEFLDIIETAEEEGVLDKEKQVLVRSALSFDEVAVGDVFTPRENVIAIEVNSTAEEVLQTIKSVKYSRLPVYENNLDNIIGILHVRDFLKYILKHKEFDMRNLLINAHMTSSTTCINDLLHEMSTKKLHMAVVVDHADKTLGIITIEDILEELVGDIWDEDDVVSESKPQLASPQAL
jgi:putative hemolysin